MLFLWAATADAQPATAPVELLDFQVETAASQPYVAFRFSSAPELHRRDAHEGSQAVVVLEFPGAASRATTADYSREFAPPSPLEASATIAGS